MRLRWLVPLPLLLAPAVAGGAEAAAEAVAPAPADGYCAWVRGTADAEAALLFAPEVFSEGGFTTGGIATGAAPVDRPRPRLTIGARYDAIDVWQGVTIRSRAEALCRREIAKEAIEAMLVDGAASAGRTALERRAQTLEQLLPDADRLLAELDRAVRDELATVDELAAARIRADALRALLRDTRAELARATVAAPPPGRPIPGLLAAFRDADGAVEEEEESLRNAQAFELSVRAGYDRLFGVDQELPVFALVSVGFDFGRFFQGSANERAAVGRQRLVEEDLGGAGRKLHQLGEELAGVVEAERKRLGEVKALRGDLEAQLEAVKALPTAQVRRFRDTLWFDVARLRAEEAYLESHVAELGKLLGGGT